MASGWWSGLEKALDIVSGLTGGGRPPDEPDAGMERGGRAAGGGGLLGGFEARLAGVLVSALHEAFARDAARLDVEREQAEAERRRAEAALRLEMARQEAERRAAHLRAVLAINIVVWLTSVLVIVVHPFAGIASRVLLAAAWTALTAGIAVAFVAYGTLSAGAAALTQLDASAFAEPSARRPRVRIIEAASWLTVSGLGLAAASVIVGMI